MMQLRHRGGSHEAYNFRRDIVNLFPDIARFAAYRLHESGWHPVIQQWAAQSGLTEADLTEGAVALKKFVGSPNAAGVSDIRDAWENSGMARLKAPTLMALLFEIGSGTVAAFFHSARAAQPVGFVPTNAPLVEALVDEMKSAVRAPTKAARARRVKNVNPDSLA